MERTPTWEFAKAVVPEAYFRDPASTFGRLAGAGAEEWLQERWAEALRRVGGQLDASQPCVVARSASLVIVKLPTVREPNEVIFVAIATPEETPQIVYYEWTFAADLASASTTKAMLSTTDGSTSVKLGPKPDVSLDGFLAALGPRGLDVRATATAPVFRSPPQTSPSSFPSLPRWQRARRAPAMIVSGVFVVLLAAFLSGFRAGADAAPVELEGTYGPNDDLGRALFALRGSVRGIQRLDVVGPGGPGSTRIDTTTRGLAIDLREVADAAPRYEVTVVFRGPSLFGVRIGEGERVVREVVIDRQLAMRYDEVEGVTRLDGMPGHIRFDDGELLVRRGEGVRLEHNGAVGVRVPVDLVALLNEPGNFSAVVAGSGEIAIRGIRAVAPSGLAFEGNVHVAAAALQADASRVLLEREQFGTTRPLLRNSVVLRDGGFANTRSRLYPAIRVPSTLSEVTHVFHLQTGWDGVESCGSATSYRAMVWLSHWNRATDDYVVERFEGENPGCRVHGGRGWCGTRFQRDVRGNSEIPLAAAYARIHERLGVPHTGVPEKLD